MHTIQTTVDVGVHIIDPGMYVIEPCVDRPELRVDRPELAQHCATIRAAIPIPVPTVHFASVLISMPCMDNDYMHMILSRISFKKFSKLGGQILVPHPLVLQATCHRPHLIDCVQWPGVESTRKFIHISMQMLGAHEVMRPVVSTLQQDQNDSIPFVCA